MHSSNSIGDTSDREKSVIDVWDFGAEQLLGENINYNNLLTVDKINDFFDEYIEPGSNAVTFPMSFTVGDLSWSAIKTNNLLRTSNTLVTRYDENVKLNEIGDAPDLYGCLYLNGSKNAGHFNIKLEQNDVVNVYVKFDNADDAVIFKNAQNTYSFAGSVSGTQVTFVAPEAGTYKISDSELNGKPRYYRITRENSTTEEIFGNITSEVDLPEGTTVVFTNDATGVEYTSSISNSKYHVSLPVYTKGMQFSIGLANAKGCAIDSESSVTLSGYKQIDISVKKVALVTIGGKISGLPADALESLKLEFNPPQDKVFKPEMVIDGDSFSIDLEQGVKHEVKAIGVNDYKLAISAYEAPTENAVMDLYFTAKPVYNINLELEKLSSEETDAAKLVFNNLHEEAYAYEFTGIEHIQLRQGTYSIDIYTKSKYAQKLTSNLVVEGNKADKTIGFELSSIWNFSNKSFTSEKCDFGAYNGLLLDAIKKSRSYLLGVAGSTVKVPVTGNSNVIISYVYSAAGTIGEIKFETSSKSTSLVESTSCNYNGEAGYLNIVFDAKTYVKKIEVKPIVKYAQVITVGNHENDYKTINRALYAVSCMERPNNERVTIEIRPGNYEEMVVVDEQNVTIVNKAQRPSIALNKKGVGIDKNAVRITSYYGHGCNYYSMGSDTKHCQKELEVNKQNGYLSYDNPGSGSTKGSYWNATVVVKANGFQASGIIFENSFNSYVSAKEACDIVEPGPTNKGGERPKTVRDTSVQNKKFVERAAAMAIVDGTDKVIFSSCRFVGKQDTIYGGKNARILFNKCNLMGATDYIFGGMIAVFYKCDLTMNTSDADNDKCYITAAQQSTGRGYLMCECKITSAIPGVDNASTYRSKPGFLGRPWAGKTSEVVYYNTTIETTDYVGYEGQSLIVPEGWNSSLGGPANCYEYATTELSKDTDNSTHRVEWATILEKAQLPDGTVINQNTWLKNG